MILFIKITANITNIDTNKITVKSIATPEKNST